ncbi:MAG TPA: hypothetical protein VFY18_15495 [Candidatus Limnocylindrales bacterium]|nr:hypothetical protein [Candidatus Limnocylindrales bacterium]
MDEQAVRQQAQAFCDALVAGDVDRAIGDFSNELRRNLGEVLALLPLPANDATLESVDHGGTGYDVVIRFLGETEEVQIQTRWKDRDGKPTIVEASHLSKTATAVEAADEDEAPEGDGDG